MPTMPWTAIAPAESPGVHLVVTEFRLARLRDTPAFLRDSRRVTAQMRTAEGLVGYALQARILRRTYRTVSAWRSPADARAFGRSGAHGRIAAAAAAGTRPSALARWDAPASAMPPTWESVQEALRGGPIGVTSPSGTGVGSGG